MRHLRTLLPETNEIARRVRSAGLVLLTGAVAFSALAADTPKGNAKTKKQAAPVGGEPIPLNPEGTVLLDKKGKRVLLKTQVALRQGSLELFCCRKGSKEHESILSLDSRAQVVHAGLLALGAKPGTPVQYNPDYQPPTGQRIDIFVNWTDEEDKQHREPARSWVRQAINRHRIVKMEMLPRDLQLPKNTELRYDRKLKELSWYGPMTVEQQDELTALSDDKDYRAAIQSFFEQSQPREMQADWVFAGSGFFKDKETGKETYLADEGDMICVANFGSAMIDVAMPSTSENADLQFEAYTERIPPKDTPVTVELIPVVAPEKSQPKK